MIDMRKPALCNKYYDRITKDEVKAYFERVRGQEGIRTKLAAGLKKFMKSMEKKKKEKELKELREMQE